MTDQSRISEISICSRRSWKNMRFWNMVLINAPDYGSNYQKKIWARILMVSKIVDLINGSYCAIELPIIALHIFMFFFCFCSFFYSYGFFSISWLLFFATVFYPKKSKFFTLTEYCRNNTRHQTMTRAFWLPSLREPKSSSLRIPLGDPHEKKGFACFFPLGFSLGIPHKNFSLPHPEVFIGAEGSDIGQHARVKIGPWVVRYIRLLFSIIINSFTFFLPTKYYE